MIAGNLEYLMSSLPYLSFDDSEQARYRVISLLGKYAGPSKADQNPVAILEHESGKYLSPGKTEILRSIRLENIHEPGFRKQGNKILSAFSDYMCRLKEDIRQLRLARRNAGEASAVSIPSLPLVPGTPLEEEIQLMQWQWNTLEALSTGHYADFGALCIYKLKLLLLLRWWGFDTQKGFEIFLNSTETTG